MHQSDCVRYVYLKCVSPLYYLPTQKDKKECCSEVRDAQTLLCKTVRSLMQETFICIAVKSVMRQNLLREAVRVVTGRCPTQSSKSSDGTDSPMQSSKRIEGACFLHSRSWLLESLTDLVAAVSLQPAFAYTYLRLLFPCSSRSLTPTSPSPCGAVGLLQLYSPGSVFALSFQGIGGNRLGIGWESDGNRIGGGVVIGSSPI